MGNARKRWVRGAGALAILALLSAVAVISPVGAFEPGDKGKVRQIAKNKATKVFNQEFTGAFDAAFATASAPLQSECKDGAVLAHATVVGDAAFGTAFTSDPTKVQNAFNCKSATNSVRVRRTGSGVYQVSLPGISTDPANTGKWVVVTSAVGVCFFGCSDTIVFWFPLTEPTEGQIIQFYIGDAQPAADGANDVDLYDGQFSFAVLDYS
jgi:hypothetical protein